MPLYLVLLQLAHRTRRRPSALPRKFRYNVPNRARLPPAANAKAANAYRDGRYPLPQNSILVKTLHDDPTCTTPVGYVAMRKDDGWVWQETAANFEVRDTGALQSCIACHSNCDDRDLTCTEP